MPLEYPNEDLFEGTKMSFGEHLEELRGTLIRSLIGLCVGMLIALLFAGKVVTFLQTPLEEALREFTIDKAEMELKEENGGIVPPELGARLHVDRLRPQELQVNPHELIAVLRPYLAEELIAEDVVTRPYAIRLFQLKPGQEVPLAQALEAAGRSEEPKDLHRIWQLLSESQLAELSRIAAQETASTADREALLVVLNDLAEDPELYASEEFSPLLKGKVRRGGLRGLWNSWFGENDERTAALQAFRKQLEQEPDPNLTRRLNNWLLSLSLNAYLNEPVLELAEVRVWETTKINPQALNAHEVFMIYLKAALITGALISSPWVFYQVWLFVAAGLYPHEKNYVYIYLPFSIVLFLGGAGIAFFLAFEPVLKFLFSFNASMGIDPQPRIGEWLSFVMFMPIGFGLAFQLPLVMLFVNRIGIVSIEMFLSKWRIAVLIIFVLAMVLTPADPISMILLALPLTVLYFGGIGLCRWMPRGQNPFSEAYEPG